MRSADQLVSAMADAGVKVIFSLSGNQIMPVYDACLDHDIRIVHVRHEAAAVFMADAWHQVTGQPGVALITAAPGFANALGALYSAHMADSAVILLSGDSPVGQDGLGAFQEFDQVSAASPFVRKSHRAMHGESLGTTFTRLWHQALQAPRQPVHLALPADVLDAEPAAARLPPPGAIAPGVIDPEALQGLVSRLQAARRPLILAGPQLCGAWQAQALRDAQRVLGVPVVPMTSPRGLRDPSLGSFAGCLEQADLLVLLGKRADFTVNFLRPGSAPGPDVVVVNGDSDLIAQAVRAAAGRVRQVLQADPAVVLGQLVQAIGAPASPADWCEQVGAAVASRRLNGAEPAFVAGLRCINDWLARQPNPLVVIDGGEFGQWSQAFVQGPRRVINGVSGAIGGGIAYAIGASLADPSAQVLLLMGDGTSGFHLGEFDTAVRAGATFTAVIGNDSCWNAERQIQIRDYGPQRQIGCMLNPATRYDQAVAALGGHGAMVEAHEHLTSALDAAQASGLPACIDWRIDGAPAPVFAAAGMAATGH